MSERIKNVCMVRFGGMGDILLATPTLRAIATTFETNSIDVILAPSNVDSITGIPYIRRPIPWDKHGADRKFANFVRFLSQLRRERYDLFLNFQPGLRANIMAQVSGAKQVITFQKDRSKQRETGRILHAIDDYAKELKHIGIESVTDRRMDFHVPDAARKTCQEKLTQKGITGRYIVVNPAGTRIINRYPPERFGAAITAIAEALPGVAMVLSGGRNEEPLAASVLQHIAPGVKAYSMAGELNVKEAGALLAGAACVLTGDTGPLHIASAVGARIVCLSGAADPDRTGPTAPHDLVVIRRDLDCVPCRDRTCRRKDIACMTGLPVEWVVNAVLKRLENS